MPSNFKSPYATSFNSAVKRGVSFVSAVNSIAKRTSKTPKTVWASLFKAGVVNRQKFNGQWVYWPVNWKRASAGVTKEVQFNNWQCFVEWCIVSGMVNPEKMSKATGSQVEFMNFCRKFFAKQFTSSTKSKSRKSSPKRKSTTSARKRPSAKRSTRRSPSKKSTVSRKRTTTKAKARSTNRKSKTSSARRVSASSRKRTSTRRTVSRAA